MLKYVLWILLLLYDSESYFNKAYVCQKSSDCDRIRPCQIFDNVTCILDPKENCRPRYISSVDESEVNCSQNDRLYCTDEEVRLSCPENTTVKICMTSIVEMAPSYCLLREPTVNDRPLVHCNYSSISDDPLVQVFTLCSNQRNCTFRFQDLLDTACNGFAFWQNGNAVILRLEHQCIEERRGNLVTLWIPLLWILISVIFAMVLFGLIVFFDWSSWIRRTRHYLNRTYWQSTSPPLLLSSDADFV